MIQTKEKIVEVEKEKIPFLNFPSENVITDKDAQKQLLSKIQAANDYGNLAQHKVSIKFRDSEGLKKVFTTIWDVKNQMVYLKHNITIPITRIVDVIV